jgi:hypothetical protein
VVKGVSRSLGLAPSNAAKVVCSHGRIRGGMTVGGSGPWLTMWSPSALGSWRPKRKGTPG